MSDNKDICSCGNHTCDCEHDHEMTEFEHDTIRLTLEDGSDLLCAILAEYPVQGRDYIALLAIDENGEQIDDHPYFYRYSEEDGDPILDDILDDDEYDAVVDRFDEMLDENEFANLDSE